jgi:hypothetical protein
MSGREPVLIRVARAFGWGLKVGWFKFTGGSPCQNPPRERFMKSMESHA